MVTLLSIALTSIIGTLIPQGRTPEEYRQAFGEGLYRLFYLLDVFDMYHAWWFQFLLMLLTVNIIVCSIDRLSSTWKIIFPKRIVYRPKSFQNATEETRFTLDVSMQDALDIGAEIIRKQFRSHVQETHADTTAILGDRRRWTRLGVYAVHFSVILLLLGGVIGAWFGFDGFVMIPEGESRDQIELHRTGEIKKLPFAIQCERFSLTFYEDEHRGMPKEFRSALTLLKDGQSILNKEIIVNDPLRYQGINIFQSSYRQLPAASAPQNIEIEATGSETGMIYTLKPTIGNRLKLPEGDATLTLTGYRSQMDFRGFNLGAVLVGQLDMADGTSVGLLLPLKHPTFDQMMTNMEPKRKGGLIFKVTQVDQSTRYATGLQVTHDPGVWWVYAGFVMMIVGCWITFFLSHQQLCIEIQGKGGKSQIRIAGKTNRGSLAMLRMVEKTAARFQNRLR